MASDRSNKEKMPARDSGLSMTARSGTGLGVVVLAFLLLGAAHPSAAQDTDYIVRLNYPGTQNLYEAEVLLYDVDRACSTLSVHPTEPPSIDAAWKSLVILPTPEGTFPDRGLNVPAEIETHYAVARAQPADGSGGGTGYFSVFGCNDQIAPPSPAGSVLIEIDMEDIPIFPRISPSSGDFGSVELGSSRAIVMTISNDGVVPVSDVYVDLSGASFSMTAGPDWPIELPLGASASVEVTFTPPSLGFHEGTLLVGYTIGDLPAGYQAFDEEVSLSGTGVGGVPPPWTAASTAPVERSAGSNYLLASFLVAGVLVLCRRWSRKGHGRHGDRPGPDDAA